MNYAAQATGDVKSQTSLVTDGQQLDTRLSEIALRIEKIGDTLHGSEPRDVAGTVQPPSPPTIRRVLDTGHELATRIESLLSKIENRL